MGTKPLYVISEAINTLIVEYSGCTFDMELGALVVIKPLDANAATVADTSSSAVRKEGGKPERRAAADAPAAESTMLRPLLPYPTRGPKG